MRDEAYATCPKELCRQAKWGKGKVKRLLGTGAGLIFKGSGFYITDSRRNNYTDGAKKESPASGEKKSESGATKSEPKTAPSSTPAPASPKKKDSNA